jgi:hypothetical protein
MRLEAALVTVSNRGTSVFHISTIAKAADNRSHQKLMFSNAFQPLGELMGSLMGTA